MSFSSIDKNTPPILHYNLLIVPVDVRKLNLATVRCGSKFGISCVGFVTQAIVGSWAHWLSVTLLPMDLERLWYASRYHCGYPGSDANYSILVQGPSTSRKLEAGRDSVVLIRDFSPSKKKQREEQPTVVRTRERVETVEFIEVGR